MAGCPIERHVASNILFARCNECGMPSPLTEYPSAAGWLAQLQSLAATAVLVLSLLAVVVQMLLCWGSVAFMLIVPAEMLVAPLFNAFQLATKNQDGYAATADMVWLATEEGQRALASECSVWNAGWLVFYLVFFAMIPALVSGMLGGVAFLRGSLPRRMLMGSLGPLAFCVGWYAFDAGVSPTPLLAARGITPTWAEVVDLHLQPQLHVLAALTLLVGTLVGTWIGPTVLRGIATTILPPRERNLVAWIWTFAGKQVPRH